MQYTALASEYPFACMAAGIESLVVGFALHVGKKRTAFLAQSSILYSFLFKDIKVLAFQRQKMGRTNNESRIRKQFR